MSEDAYPFLTKHHLQGTGHIFILLGNQSGSQFKYCDLAAKVGQDRGQLTTGVRATNNGNSRRELLQGPDIAIGQR